jgi:hypothetical protein
MQDGIDLADDLVGARIDAGLDKVEPPIGGIEPPEDLALELLEDGEGEAGPPWRNPTPSD